jgi:hypothetical protein
LNYDREWTLKPFLVPEQLDKPGDIRQVASIEIKPDVDSHVTKQFVD